jgi:hypothetical protein
MLIALDQKYFILEKQERSVSSVHHHLIYVTPRRSALGLQAIVGYAYLASV